MRSNLRIKIETKELIRDCYGRDVDLTPELYEVFRWFATIYSSVRNKLRLYRFLEKRWRQRYRYKNQKYRRLKKQYKQLLKTTAEKTPNQEISMSFFDSILKEADD